MLPNISVADLSRLLGPNVGYNPLLACSWVNHPDSHFTVTARHKFMINNLVGHRSTYCQQQDVLPVCGKLIKYGLQQRAPSNTVAITEHWKCRVHLELIQVLYWNTVVLRLKRVSFCGSNMVLHGLSGPHENSWRTFGEKGNIHVIWYAPWKALGSLNGYIVAPGSLIILWHRSVPKHLNFAKFWGATQLWSRGKGGPLGISRWGAEFSGGYQQGQSWALPELMSGVSSSWEAQKNQELASDVGGAWNLCCVKDVSSWGMWRHHGLVLVMSGKFDQTLAVQC